MTRSHDHPRRATLPVVLLAAAIALPLAACAASQEAEPDSAAATPNTRPERRDISSHEQTLRDIQRTGNKR